jgi:hypothetical protein
VSNTEVNDLLNFDAAKHDDGIKRDQYGRYLIPDPATGEVRAWTRATTLSSILDDAKALQTWNDRNLAFGIGRREDLFAMAASVATSTEAEDKKCLDDVIATARTAAQQDAKANLGTALHGFTQRFDVGEKGVEVPSQWKADIDAYLAGMKAYALWPYERMVEVVLIVPELECAGTADRFLCGDNFPGDLPVVGDLKTGKVEGKGRQFAVQLAIYAHASHWYDPKTGELHEMPKVNQSQGIVIHLPVGQAEVHFYEVDLVAGWEAAQLAYDIHKWRRRNDLATPLAKPETIVVSSVKVTPLGADGEPSGPTVELPDVKSVQLKRAAKKRAVKKTAIKHKQAPCVDCNNAIEPGTQQRYVNEETGEIVEPLCKNDFDSRQANLNPPARWCATCIEDVPAVEYSEHVDKHLFDARFEYAKARVKYVIDGGQGAELGDAWANGLEGVPTFKKGGPRTHQEIDRIVGICSVVEMAHSMPFPDFVDPAKQKHNKYLEGKQDNEQRELSTSS